MEKLIELLNEYGEYRGKVADRTEQDLISYYYIISKKFGFIKWLVENDKIDLDKVKQEAMSWFYDESPVYGNEIWTDRLIMILSVSYNPISDLVYYLKE